MDVLPAEKKYSGQLAAVRKFVLFNRTSDKYIPIVIERIAYEAAGGVIWRNIGKAIKAKADIPQDKTLPRKERCMDEDETLMTSKERIQILSRK